MVPSTASVPGSRLHPRCVCVCMRRAPTRVYTHDLITLPPCLRSLPSPPIQHRVDASSTCPVHPLSSSPPTPPAPCLLWIVTSAWASLLSSSLQELSLENGFHVLLVRSRILSNTGWPCLLRLVRRCLWPFCPLCKGHMAGHVGPDFTEVSGTSQKSQFKTEVVDLVYFGQEVAVCLLGQKAKGGAGGSRGFW